MVAAVESVRRYGLQHPLLQELTDDVEHIQKAHKRAEEQKRDEVREQLLERAAQLAPGNSDSLANLEHTIDRAERYGVEENLVLSVYSQLKMAKCEQELDEAMQLRSIRHLEIAIDQAAECGGVARVKVRAAERVLEEEHHIKKVLNYFRETLQLPGRKQRVLCCYEELCQTQLGRSEEGGFRTPGKRYSQDDPWVHAQAAEEVQTDYVEVLEDTSDNLVLIHKDAYKDAFASCCRVAVKLAKVPRTVQLDQEKSMLGLTHPNVVKFTAPGLRVLPDAEEADLLFLFIFLVNVLDEEAVECAGEDAPEDVENGPYPSEDLDAASTDESTQDPAESAKAGEADTHAGVSSKEGDNESEAGFALFSANHASARIFIPSATAMQKAPVCRHKAAQRAVAMKVAQTGLAPFQDLARNSFSSKSPAAARFDMWPKAAGDTEPAGWPDASDTPDASPALAAQQSPAGGRSVASAASDRLKREQEAAKRTLASAMGGSQPAHGRMT
ncbi:hypothetical protein AK812_SmicGene41213 [Symbiodinium microadriaticum]|uniref:Protein kinase domain-containing protein n=1 Tax=Symbiodinium microadriaticum TaxID=2951 RepID=A0A1Q9C6Q6_SYMMI|nr:hypothetical protein AK812_SmicGene41213 [Symbiodinium microadriaticum]